MRICAIVNPRAGGWKRLNDPAAVADPLATVARWIAPDAPESIKVYAMRGPDEGAQMANTLINEGFDTIVAVGGDGTINDVIQSVATAGLGTRFGLIPMGTANVLSRVLGIPRNDPAAAARIIREGKEHPIDLARANGKWFSLVAGIGFDGAVTHAVNFRLKRRIGRLAYGIATVQVAMNYPRRHIRLTLDHGETKEFNSYMTLVANGGRYAGRFQLGPHVRIDDGYLDVFVCMRRRPLLRSLTTHGIALLRDRLHTASAVQHFRVKHLTLDAAEPLPIELDGDAAGDTPITIEIVPKALNVLVPKDF